MVRVVQQDLNTPVSIDGVLAGFMAHHSLHHVVDLESLFDTVFRHLHDRGSFVVADVIGRNGHSRWPETLALVREIWTKLPERLKFDQVYGRTDCWFENRDCSIEGFEGIRAAGYPSIASGALQLQEIHRLGRPGRRLHQSVFRAELRSSLRRRYLLHRQPPSGRRSPARRSEAHAHMHDSDHRQTGGWSREGLCRRLANVMRPTNSAIVSATKNPVVNCRRGGSLSRGCDGRCNAATLGRERLLWRPGRLGALLAVGVERSRGRTQMGGWREQRIRVCVRRLEFDSNHGSNAWLHSVICKRAAYRPASEWDHRGRSPFRQQRSPMPGIRYQLAAETTRIRTLHLGVRSIRHQAPGRRGEGKKKTITSPCLH